MQTLISTACASAQWNDLPKATWKSHELSRPGSCSPPPDTWALCTGPGARVIWLNPVSHFTCLFSTPPSYTDSEVLGAEKHVCHHSCLEDLKSFRTRFDVAGWGCGERSQETSTFLGKCFSWLTLHFVPPPYLQQSHPSLLWKNIGFLEHFCLERIAESPYKYLEEILSLVISLLIPLLLVSNKRLFIVLIYYFLQQSKRLNIHM